MQNVFIKFATFYFKIVKKVGKLSKIMLILVLIKSFIKTGKLKNLQYNYKILYNSFDW